MKRTNSKRSPGQTVETKSDRASTSVASRRDPQNKPPASMQRETFQLSSALRFSPTAWAKLLYFRDRAQTEVGGFGISAPDDLLCVEDFVTVRQNVTMASVAFDDEAVADFFEDQVDAGRKPEQFARTWLHTHPGNSARPSATDEETFHRVFGKCDWAVLFILAHGGRSYARLRFNAGPGGQIVVPVEADYSRPFGPSDPGAWEAEYNANIKADVFGFGGFGHDDYGAGLADSSCPDEWLEHLDDMDPAERQILLNELAIRAAEEEVACEY